MPQTSFPKLSDAKIQAGVFTGPQIKVIITWEEFRSHLTQVERESWDCFVAVARGLLGNNKADNYKELAKNMVEAYGSIYCRISLKVHMLDSHLDHFQHNVGAYSEEIGERFHQDILDFERRYQGQYNQSMMGDCIWGLIRENVSLHARKARKMSHY